mgnify:FL=1
MRKIRLSLHTTARAAWFAAFAIAAGATAVAQDTVRTDNVVARIVTESTHATPGTEFNVGLHLDIRDGWHTYWVNPGESGEATRIDWVLPEGISAGDILWPAPERVPAGPLVNYGYHGEVLHIVPLEIPADWPVDRPLRLEAAARWLVCEETCIPEEGRFVVEVPVGPATWGPDSALFAAARETIPVESPWRAAFYIDGDDIELTLGSQIEGSRIVDAQFFPLSWGHVTPSAPQSWRTTDSGIQISLAAGDAPPTDVMDGVVVLTEISEGETRSRPLSVTAEAVSAPAPGPAAGVGLLAALGLALIGGLLLNAMPCVFPVLSLKAMEVAGLGGSDTAAARRQGLAYTAGVLVFFALLGLLLLALRGGGAAVGWGFQLQYPFFVAGMAYLMFLLGLMMLGMLELGTSWMGAGDNLTRRHGWQGSFFTGALAALVATPCTAPFMGAALGYALTQPAPAALAIMCVLGLGLALPFLLLGFFPAVAGKLPRPGPWMSRLRSFLAFPLFATAVWLLWVLDHQVSENSLALVLAGMVALAWGLWMWREARRSGPAVRRVMRVTAVVLLAAAIAPLTGLGDGAEGQLQGEVPPAAGYQAYSPDRLSELRAANQPVFVNLTAAWCITCQVNERVVLSTDTVRQALRDFGVTYLKGDWTNRDPDITALLDAHNRAGVPLYLVYPASGAPPRILPQILTESLVVDALAAAAGESPSIPVQTRLQQPLEMDP